MKLKYYLRGLGIGIIISTIILTVSFCGQDVGREISDEEIIKRAMELGMVMPEEDTEEGMIGTDRNTEAGSEDGSAVQGDDMVSNNIGAPEEPVQNPDVQAPIWEGTYRLVIERGDVCRVVCEKLAENGVIEDAEALRTYLFEIGYASNMSIGSYDVPYGMTNEQIAGILMAGPIMEEEE